MANWENPATSGSFVITEAAQHLLPLPW